MNELQNYKIHLGHWSWVHHVLWHKWHWGFWFDSHMVFATLRWTWLWRKSWRDSLAVNMGSFGNHAWPRTTAVSCDKLSASITHGDIIWSCALTFPGCFLCQYAKHPKPSSKPILFDGGWWLRLSENDVKFTNFWFFCESLWSIAGIRCSPAGGVPLFQWEPNTKPLSASLTHSILPEGFASRIFKKWIFQKLTPTICPSN